jgi:outer membrane receptor protein involved in Fe transport
VALYKTHGRRRLSTTRSDTVGQSSLGAFAETEIEWSSTFRTLLGLRGDVYRFAVRSDKPRNSGTDTDGLLSPKLSATMGSVVGP